MGVVTVKENHDISRKERKTWEKERIALKTKKDRCPSLKKG